MFAYSQWMSLPLSTRDELARALGISKTGSIEVVDNRVSKDGYSLNDVESILTLEKFQAYTGANTDDANMLWQLAIEKAEDNEPIVVSTEGMEVAPEEMQQAPVEIAPEPTMPPFEETKPEEVPEKVDDATAIEPAAPEVSEPIVEPEVVSEEAPKAKGRAKKNVE